MILLSPSNGRRTAKPTTVIDGTEGIQYFISGTVSRKFNFESSL